MRDSSFSFTCKIKWEAERYQWKKWGWKGVEAIKWRQLAMVDTEVCNTEGLKFGKRGTAWWSEDLFKLLEKKKSEKDWIFQKSDESMPENGKYKVLNRNLKVGAYE